MDQVENKDVVAEEIVTPKTEAAQEQVTEAQPITTPAPQEDKQERNWQAMRRAKEELESRLKLQEQFINNMMSGAIKNQPTQAPEEDIISEIQKEEYVPGEKVARGLKKIEEKFARQLESLREEQFKAVKNSQLMSLKSKYSDFDEVMSPENIEIFEQNDPDEAQIIADIKDPYKMAILTYKRIKSQGIPEKTSSKRSKEMDQKIEQNKKTVQSPQAFDKRPMAQAFKKPTKKEDEATYREMMDYASRAGGGY